MSHKATMALKNKNEKQSPIRHQEMKPAAPPEGEASQLVPESHCTLGRDACALEKAGEEETSHSLRKTSPLACEEKLYLCFTFAIEFYLTAKQSQIAKYFVYKSKIFF